MGSSIPGVYYILSDHLGGTYRVVDSAGGNRKNSIYYSFGENRALTSGIQTDRLFTGQRADADVGFYHYGARFYDPYLDRFISPDTIVSDLANPQCLNRYSYVNNNPLRYTDPTGHVVPLLIGAIVLTVAVLDVIDIGSSLYTLHLDSTATPADRQAASDNLGMYGTLMACDGPAPVGDAVAAGRGAFQTVKRLFKGVDSGVAAYRAARGGGIHPATTGKAFSDWFKMNILHDPKAKGMYINKGQRRLDLVDDAGTLVQGGGKQIYELKNYTKNTGVGKDFWDQAKAYSQYASANGYTMNYVFGDKVDDSIFQGLWDLGIKDLWYIDDAGKMVQWQPQP